MGKVCADGRGDREAAEIMVAAADGELADRVEAWS
jgi:hypothetical protein